ncbi:MAG: hypothetical protein LBM23_00185 [Propionibacteriaceae bacterium]|jgi:catechol 2,3-dioxygenase-like lactoylglutathione lyase family enzyme|nr:hypothetical protein [Propionibacteriaceae bacterium]
MSNSVSPRKPYIQEVTFDCADGALLAEFWGRLLERPWGYSQEPGGVVDTGSSYLLFQVVPEPKSSYKNRLHLDIEVDDLEAEAARVAALGATRLCDHIDESGGGFIVFRDPEENEFCLVCQPNNAWDTFIASVLDPSNRGELLVDPSPGKCGLIEQAE